MERPVDKGALRAAIRRAFTDVPLPKRIEDMRAPSYTGDDSYDMAAAFLGKPSPPRSPATPVPSPRRSGRGSPSWSPQRAADRIAQRSLATTAVERGCPCMRSILARASRMRGWRMERARSIPRTQQPSPRGGAAFPPGDPRLADGAQAHGRGVAGLGSRNARARRRGPGAGPRAVAAPDRADQHVRFPDNVARCSRRRVRYPDDVAGLIALTIRFPPTNKQLASSHRGPLFGEMSRPSIPSRHAPKNRPHTGPS